MAIQTPAPGGALYPVLPLRDVVVFPHMIVPLFVGREKIRARVGRCDAGRQANFAADTKNRDTG